MRVLFLTGEFPPQQGGVGDCTNEIALALVQRGVDVFVLTTAHKSSVVSHQLSVSNLQSLDIARDKSPVSNLRVLPTIKKWNWSALAQIRKTIAETRAEIVHIQYQTGAFGMHPMINFAPRLLTPRPPLLKIKNRFLGEGGKWVVTFHDLRPMYLFPKAGRVRDWVTFQLARASDAVIATNEQDYLSLATRHLSHLSLIPIGSNITPPPVIARDEAISSAPVIARNEAISSAPVIARNEAISPLSAHRDAFRARLGVQRDEILLCYFGFLNDSKGGETLIRALAEIPNAKLLMLGGQTGGSDATNVAYLARVKNMITELNLTHRVIWTDFMPQAEISAHFFASDMCVLPYRDGASYRRGTFMAALAHGMAIVTTEVEASSLIPHPSSLPSLRDGENVLLIPPDDPRAIADAVNRIASSPELREKLQQGARETAQFFTWAKIADAHLELYEKILTR